MAGNFAFVLAYNEEANIGKVLKGLKQALNAGVISRIIVVDDGSKDNTAKIAESEGIQVLRLPENKGKGNAFIQAAKLAWNEKAENMVLFDADLLNVDAKKVKALIEPLRNPKLKMTVGTVVGDGTAMSGERAIRVSALKPLVVAQNKNWIKAMQGFGLEAALNHYLGVQTRFFPKWIPILGGRLHNPKFIGTPVKTVRTKFTALQPARRGNWVNKEMWQTREKLMRRHEAACWARKVKKKHSEKLKTAKPWQRKEFNRTIREQIRPYLK